MDTCKICGGRCKRGNLQCAKCREALIEAYAFNDEIDWWARSQPAVKA